MENTWSEAFLNGRLAPWLVAAMAALLFLTTNLPWQLDDYDQAKQAYTSLEMLKEGHWLYQHTPHERIATKPPLVGWISAAVFEISRSWGLAWRLPSIAAAAALAVVLFRAGGRAHGPVAGLVALSAFSLNLLSPRLASLVRTDMPLALVISLVGLMIWHKIRTNESWSPRDRLWMFVLLTAGMLIKGPIVYAFLLPGIVAYQLWRRKNGGGSGWCGWWPWLLSLAIFGLWVYGGIRFVPGFYAEVVQKEFLGRFGETMHRPQPFYFYWPHLLHKFAPWSVLAVAFAVLLVRMRPGGDGGATGSAASASASWWRRISPEMCWLLCWSLGGLILMSLIPSKRVDRIFPVIPPLCLLLAAQVQRLLQRQGETRRRTFHWTTVALAAAVLFAGGYSSFKIFSGYRENRDALVKFGREVREDVAKNGRRLEVAETSDEGLLLYLEQMHFVRNDEAWDHLAEGKADALVVPATPKGKSVKTEFVPQFESQRRNGDQNYLYIVAGPK